MNRPRLEWKVGLFVALCLGLLAVLVLSFSKGMSPFSHTYRLRLRTPNVGGIKAQAGVLMAGVPVGNVQKAELDPDGRSVTLHLRIQSSYAIHRDARFALEQAGFLGDRYVSVIPGANREPVLVDNEEVSCDEPFNLQEAARAATGFIRRIDDTARRLNEAIDRIDRLVLNERTLTNLAQSVEAFHRSTLQAEKTLVRVDDLVISNLPPVNLTISNLFAFSHELRTLGADLREVLATNSTEVTEAVKSVESSATMLEGLLTDLRDGRGLAGTLLRDQQLAQDFSLLASNLTVTSSNLNARGMWGILWKPKARVAHPPAAVPPRASGRH